MSQYSPILTLDRVMYKLCRPETTITTTTTTISYQQLPYATQVSLINKHQQSTVQPTAEMDVLRTNYIAFQNNNNKKLTVTTTIPNLQLSKQTQSMKL